MTAPGGDPVATDPGTPARVAGVSWLVIVAVIGVVLVVVLVVAGWAARERSGFAPRSFAEVDAAVRAGGLVVCSAVPLADPPGTGALEARGFEVGSTTAGELSAEGFGEDSGMVCAPRATASMVVTRFADADARDAAARSLEGLVRPRGSAVVYTAGDLTILVRGGSEDAPLDRLDEALRGAGAR